MNDAFTPRIHDAPEERQHLEAEREERRKEDEVIMRFDKNPRFLAREFLDNEEEIRRLNRQIHALMTKTPAPFSNEIDNLLKGKSND